MNILHIINSFETGGAEVLLKDSINGFIKKGFPYKHYVLALLKDGELGDKFNPEAENISHLVRGKNILAKISAIKKFVKEKDIRLVHAHLYEACLFSRFLQSKSTRVVNSYHTGFHNPASIEFSRKRLLLDQVLRNRCDLYIFVSKAIQDQIIPNLGIRKNYITLPNFADERFFRSYQFNPQKELKLVTVGNLRVQKNQQLLFQVLDQLKDPRISVDVYGEGNLRSEFEAFIQATGIKGTLKGKAYITPELLSQYDAFIMTSYHEGMPVSLIEALVTGLPAVLNDLPEFRETAGEAAVYFDCNSAASLAKVLQALVEDKEKLHLLAEKSTRVAEAFSLNIFLENLNEQYLRLIKA